MPALKGGPIELRIDTEPFEAGMRRAPVAAYFWLRDSVGTAYGKHRQQWLRRKGVKFGTRSRGILVPKLNEAGVRDNRTVVYEATPTEQRRADAPIGQIRGAAFSVSAALEALESGATVTPKRGGFLAIPLKKPRKGRATRLSPRKFRRKLAKRSRLVFGKSPSGSFYLAERIRKRSGTRKRIERTKTGRERKKQRATVTDELIIRYTLVRSFTLKPVLNFYSTWDQLSGDRDRIFRRAADRLVKDVANGIRT